MQQEIGDTVNFLRDIELRLERLAREQDDISALAAEISANAGCETCALQFEDVVSQVVVYSSEQAKPPRSLVVQIESRQTKPGTEIVTDQDEIRKMTDSFRHQLESSGDD